MADGVFDGYGAALRDADQRGIYGCYVGNFGPGVWTTLGEALRTPCGRVHWAGTETAREWMGYFEGALEAGERAALEVLSAPPS